MANGKNLTEVTLIKDHIKSQSRKVFWSLSDKKPSMNTDSVPKEHVLFYH